MSEIITVFFGSIILASMTILTHHTEIGPLENRDETKFR